MPVIQSWTSSISNIPSIGTLTVADDGNTVYVLVDNTICAIIDLMGEESHYLLTGREDILFAETANVRCSNGERTDITDTAISSGFDAQCGLVALNNATFSEISLRPYSDVADTITANLPSFNPAS